MFGPDGSAVLRRLEGAAPADAVERPARDDSAALRRLDEPARVVNIRPPTRPRCAGSTVTPSSPSSWTTSPCRRRTPTSPGSPPTCWPAGSRTPTARPPSGAPPDRRSYGWSRPPVGAWLPDQPIFYPVLNEAYATQIAREWNVPASGVGHVTRFRVETVFARRYTTKRAGGGHILELWIPAEDVAALNEHLVGTIELIGTYTD